ncbi:putative MATE family efflux protein [Clostridiales Family XIII bacterium PM5-7]
MHSHKDFFAFVIPSILAFALSGVYAIVDGFFIGNSIGDDGLAAINVAYPITAFIFSIGTGIGMGGAVQYSIHSMNQKKQGKYFAMTILLLSMASIGCTLVFYFLNHPLLVAFGADDALLTYGMDYLHIIVLGSIFQIFASGLIPLLRNMGGAMHAMIAMVCGCAINIVLDYLLIWVFDFGLIGAALATVAGEGFSLLFCVIFMIKKHVKLSIPPKTKWASLTVTILKSGLSPFGLTFSPNIILILMNKFAMIYGGANAVACYAVVAYINSIILLLLQGVGDGSQPLLSQHHGQKAHEHVRFTGILAYKTAVAIAIVCMVVLYLMRSLIGPLFGASPMVSTQVVEALPYFLVGFIFMAYLRITTSWFYATEQNAFAYLLVYGEPVLLLISLLIIPQLTGRLGIWIAVPVSQILTCFMARLAQKQTAQKQQKA